MHGGSASQVSTYEETDVDQQAHHAKLPRYTAIKCSGTDRNRTRHIFPPPKMERKYLAPTSASQPHGPGLQARQKLGRTEPSSRG
jgi:hypothetical protein